MSCMFCKHYETLRKQCLKGIIVETGMESINCEDYMYNGELKETPSKPPFNWKGDKLEEYYYEQIMF